VVKKLEVVAILEVAEKKNAEGVEDLKTMVEVEAVQILLVKK